MSCCYEQNFLLVDLTPVGPYAHVPSKLTSQQDSLRHMHQMSLVPPARVVEWTTYVQATPPISDHQAAGPALSNGRCRPLHGSKAAPACITVCALSWRSEFQSRHHAVVAQAGSLSASTDLHRTVFPDEAANAERCGHSHALIAGGGCALGGDSRGH